MSVPVMAGDGSFTKVVSQLAVGDGTIGLGIPIGSTITYLNDGTTEVTRPGNSMVLKAVDSETATVSTPEGPTIATHVCEVPSGTLIVDSGNVVKAYLNNSLILTVVNQQKTAAQSIPPPTIPNPNWIECDWDTGIKADYNGVYWTVPHFPTGHSNWCTDYIFNGEGPVLGGTIIQPVLAWTNGSWTGTDWYVYNGGKIKTEDMPVNEGDLIREEMFYEGNNSWIITFTDVSTGYFRVLPVQTNFGPDKWFGQQVYWTLEGYSITSNNDVSDNIYFTNISLKRNGNAISHSFHPEVNHSGFPMLTGLSVTSSGQTADTLHTANNP